MTKTKPYLFQRIMAQLPNSGKKGVDQHFKFDYMGAAEFEYGALPKTLRTLRALGEQPTIQKLECQKLVGYYIGPSSELELAQEFWNDQFSSKPEWNLKERTYLKAEYDVDKFSSIPSETQQSRVIGWWAIDIPRPWAIFKTQEQAKLWLAEAYQNAWAEYMKDLKN